MRPGRGGKGGLRPRDPGCEPEGRERLARGHEAARAERALRDRDWWPRRSATARVQQRAGYREALYGRSRYAGDRGRVRSLRTAAATAALIACSNSRAT